MCSILKINERRIQRWRKEAAFEKFNRKPRESGNHIPFNALTPEENKLVDYLIASKENADDSCRVLSAKAMDEYEVYISHVTFHNRMKEKGINGPIGVQAKRKSVHTKPDTGDITGPNQLWSWDITFLKTTTRYKSYYLYALLDWYSRKVIAWHISEFLSSDEAQTLWDKGILSEGLKTGELPGSLCDRGSQMRSTSTKSFFMTLGVHQCFSRPRTPNDNPQIEALFSTVKNHPEYPGRFSSLTAAEEYFNSFFDWYNNEHYHTGIGMVTPSDRHSGRDAEIFKVRENIKHNTFKARRALHCK